MPSYKLHYFNLKGRGEAIRFLFAAAGQPYEDNRVEFAQWPELKPKMPQGTMPVLEIDGGKIVVSQSNAIARYLAKEFNLYGKTAIEGLYIELILETARDMAQNYAEGKFEKDETVKAEKLAKFQETVAPKFFGFLEAEIGAHGQDGFAVGNSLTLADIMTYCIEDFTCTAACLDKYPNLKAGRAKVEQNEGISQYMKTRPETPF